MSRHAGLAPLEARAPVPTRQFTPAVTRPGDTIERDADATADRAMRAAGPALRPTTGSSPAGTGGAPLTPSARRFFEPRFGRDLGHVRIHHGGSADHATANLGARAFTLGGNIFFRQGDYAPGTDRGNHLLAHELAHSLQPGAAHRIARRTLTDLPEATRKALKISRTAPPQPTVDTWIGNYFNPTAGISATPSATVEFGTEITDANQRKGLTGVTYELEQISRPKVVPASQGQPEQRTNTDPEGWPLPDNGILDLALDLRPQGGDHAIFRFIRFSEGGTAKVLVERTRIIAAFVPPGKAPPAQAPAPATGGPAPVFTGSVTVGNVSVTIDAGFSNDQGKVIADAVGLLPDPIRTNIDGITIDKASGATGPNGQNGEYEAAKDVIHLFGDVFNASPRRVGEASNSAYQIVHELAHAIDLRPEFKAQISRDKATEERKKLKKQLDHPDININDVDILGNSEDSPKRKQEVARLTAEIAKLDKVIGDANTAMKTAKSIAGSEVGGDTESLLTDFAKAIKDDGVSAVSDAKKRNKATEKANEAAAKANEANPQGPQQPIRPMEKTLSTGITNYAATDLMEAFAENMSIYLLDQALLQALRPKTHAYFVRNFPKAPPPKTP
ncbi:hypothetical protein ACFB49_00540 [Sphingomonas sp. DBB INV C78]|uniref:eCIS core domain-containing protein n=1 Tax=Sphingomonas sp. DBB INV C78 TaxID=3349434 RepID=UPI0036D42713